MLHRYIVLHKYKLIIVSVTYQQINKGVHKMKFVKYENFAAIKKYIWTENMSKKDQDLSLLFLKKIQFLFFVIQEYCQ